jgi:repressor LexA
MRRTFKQSERHKQILQAIRSLTDLRGYPPTVREIGKAVGLSSSSTVHSHLDTLESAGMIVRDPELTRAIRLVENGKSPGAPRGVVSVPVVGRVAAGSPILAAEDIEDSYPVPNEMLSGGDGFMLRVKGDSMIEDGIMNGDLVVVRRQESADNGDTVVALVGDEATVKRLYKEEGRIRLQPANQSMSPMFFPEVQVVGKVVGLVRKFS